MVVVGGWWGEGVAYRCLGWLRGDLDYIASTFGHERHCWEPEQTNLTASIGGKKKNAFTASSYLIWVLFDHNFGIFDQDFVLMCSELLRFL